MEYNSENNTKRGFGRKMTIGEKIKCIFWCVVILLFALWMVSFWPLLLLPFAIDIYWTCFIPWTWWHGIKNKFLREVMSWVDAIVFAIVAVWILQNFFFQNFQIPTTSLEKTMMAGDYLLVSKYEYGPRKPMTPLSLPVFQHTIDIFGAKLGKSYLEHPQVDYERMAGLRDINRGDIVVFNFPLGDSIMTNNPEGDYYREVKRLRALGFNSEQQRHALGEVFCRPVDRRENYVKRCVGLPGETLKIIDRQVYINDEAIDNPENMQSVYLVYTNGSVISSSYWKNLGIYTRGNNTVLDPDVWEVTDTAEVKFYLNRMGVELDSTHQIHPMYRVNMTQAKADIVAQRKDVVKVGLRPLEYEMLISDGVFPDHPSFNWHPSNFGPLWIPQAGQSIELNEETVALYGRCIRTYEKNMLERDAEGHYLLNGYIASTYTFKMDYYWMMGDNRDNSLDSRYWGFVPEDHIVGTPLFIWMSIDQETGDFRWDRLFKGVVGIK